MKNAATAKADEFLDVNGLSVCNDQPADALLEQPSSSFPRRLSTGSCRVVDFWQ